LPLRPTPLCPLWTRRAPLEARAEEPVEKTAVPLTRPDDSAAPELTLTGPLWLEEPVPDNRTTNPPVELVMDPPLVPPETSTPPPLPRALAPLVKSI